MKIRRFGLAAVVGAFALTAFAGCTSIAPVVTKQTANSSGTEWVTLTASIKSANMDFKAGGSCILIFAGAITAEGTDAHGNIKAQYQMPRRHVEPKLHPSVADETPSPQTPHPKPNQPAITIVPANHAARSDTALEAAGSACPSGARFTMAKQDFAAAQPAYDQLHRTYIRQLASMAGLVKNSGELAQKPAGPQTPAHPRWVRVMNPTLIASANAKWGFWTSCALTQAGTTTLVGRVDGQPLYLYTLSDALARQAGGSACPSGTLFVEDPADRLPQLGELYNYN